ncbi:MAG TPA: glycosyltransferase family 4 protein [Gemmatimonadaceae bacterium]|nr:glycosyltransferase family 4 protein [Gemmatimonadaceae bacterium]
MRFAILTQYYPPEIGAPQRRLSSLARHFVAAGHDVSVLTAMPNYPMGRVHDGYGGVARREEMDGVHVLRAFIYPTQKTDYAHRLANYFSFAASSVAVGWPGLARLDFLMVESPPLFLGPSGVWMSRLKGARLIFNVSDLWPESAVRLGMVREGSTVHRVSARLERYCYERSWLITGQSREIIADIEHRFPGRRTYHLSNGVDCAEFGAQRATSDARATLGALDGACVAVYAGLHGIAQGLSQLLAASNALRAAPAVPLDMVLIGDGPVKRALVDEARDLGLDRVRFLAARPAAELPALLASADILVVPLGLGIPGAVPSKLYEAMASGRPVVLVATGEAADIVRRHEAGMVIEPNDIAGLANALRTLSANPDLRRRLGANGRRAAEACFDRAAIARQFIATIEEARRP